MKRKYGDRSEWKRVIDRDYTQSFFDTKEFKGYVTLIKVNKVAAPLSTKYGEEKFCIVDDGYIWLQHFPTNKHHSVTTMFNDKGEIVQWYIDICYRNGFKNNVPWLDDLYLDIIVLPSGRVIQKDIDELEEALSKGIIDDYLYNMAWAETNEVMELIKQGNFSLLEMSNTHKDQLLKLLN